MDINKVMNISHLTANLSVQRVSNFELYRILCMIAIIAHHYMYHSGFISGPIADNPFDAKTIFLLLFGMWGKVGINCFLMITGYFMCKSHITVRKFIKLLGCVYIYRIVVYFVLFFAGFQELSVPSLVKLIMPVWNFNYNFVSCFLAFWLTIPFWNKLIQHITQRQHTYLICLLLTFYTLLASIPKFTVSINLITWFGVIYLISSYIRLYPITLFKKKRLWGIFSMISIILAMVSVLVIHYIFPAKDCYAFVSNSNKIFALTTAVSTFIWFRNLNLTYSKVINVLGSTTFGVFLLHDNSEAMYKWLWINLVDGIGHYSLPFWIFILYSVLVVLAIFFYGAFIDWIRQLWIEKPFFRWYDRKFGNNKRIQSFENMMIS
jgi:hypothetical protein